MPGATPESPWPANLLDAWNEHFDGGASETACDGQQVWTTGPDGTFECNVVPVVGDGGTGERGPEMRASPPWYTRWWRALKLSLRDNWETGEFITHPRDSREVEINGSVYVLPNSNGKEGLGYWIVGNLYHLVGKPIYQSAKGVVCDLPRRLYNANVHPIETAKGDIRGIVQLPRAWAALPDHRKQDAAVQFLSFSAFGFGASRWFGESSAAKTFDTIPEGRRLAPYYPRSRGFLGDAVNETLQAGTRIDRYGFEGGTFASPEGVPAPMRALPPGSLDKPYNVYEVIKPLHVKSGRAAPWFQQPGLGRQYELPQSIHDLIEQGIIRRVN